MAEDIQAWQYKLKKIDLPSSFISIHYIGFGEELKILMKKYLRNMTKAI